MRFSASQMTLFCWRELSCASDSVDAVGTIYAATCALCATVPFLCSRGSTIDRCRMHQYAGWRRLYYRGCVSAGVNVGHQSAIPCFIRYCEALVMQISLSNISPTLPLSHLARFYRQQLELALSQTNLVSRGCPLRTKLSGLIPSGAWLRREPLTTSFPYAWGCHWRAPTSQARHPA